MFTWAGGILLVGVAALVTVEVVTRKFFIISMSGADEISGYALAIVSTWTFSYCITSRSNIRIDVAYHFFPVWLKSVADFIGLLTLAVFATFLAYRSTQVLLVSIEYDSRSVTTLATPLWIPQFFWASGLIFFAFVAWIYLLQCIVHFLNGKISEINTLTGIKPINQNL